MADLRHVLKQLKAEKKRAQKELECCGKLFQQLDSWLENPR
jgi:hypothetical protein